MAGAIASKVAEKIKPIDLKIVRSVVEVVMRPVEGALIVRSNRFLKLEAGKNEAQYPMGAYSDKKRKALNKEMTDEMTKSVEKVGDGVEELFKKTIQLVHSMYNYLGELYGVCINYRDSFDKAVKNLDQLRNDNAKKSCKNYDELKDTFWAAGDKQITEDDLGFDDNVGDQLSPEYFITHQAANVDDVLAQRKKAKDAVLGFAKILRAGIVKIMNYEMTEKDIADGLGAFTFTPPKDYKKKVSNAISKEKCPKFMMYDLKLINADYKDLKKEIKFDAEHVKACKRWSCLNLIEGLELDKLRAKNASGDKIEKPTFENILKDNNWADYVNSLTSTPELKKDDKPSLGSVVGDPLKKAFTDIGKDVKGFKKAYQELFAWNDGNKGQILIGTDNNTYFVKGGNNNATIDQFETKYYLTVTDAANNNNPVKKFINKIKLVLNGI